MIDILKLKAKLKEKNTTQEILASKIGVDPSTLNRKLNDKSGKNFSIGDVIKLKEILGLSNSEIEAIFFAD